MCLCQKLKQKNNSKSKIHYLQFKTYINLYKTCDKSFTLFRIGWQKGPPIGFPSVTSRHVGISPKNFLAFSFNPFATLV